MHKKLVHMGVKESRRLQMFIGDWSGDGHDKSDKIIVSVSASDVSDEALLNSYQKSVDEFGHDLFKSFESYEESSISDDLFFKFVGAGFDPERMESNLFAITTDPEEPEFDPVALMMWYIGKNIEGFEWSIVQDDYPTLLGGGDDSILANGDRDRGSYGYGLYY